MKQFTKWQREALKLATWAEINWVSVVVMYCSLLMGLLVLVVLSGLIGYWCNGLIGTKFDLGFCWAGVGAIGTGMLSVAGMAGAAWSKYYTDSKLNSQVGKAPSAIAKIKEVLKV